MRAVLTTALLLVLASGCGTEVAPPEASPTAPSGFCDELEGAAASADLVGVEPPADLTEAEAEGYRLLTAQGVAPPDSPREQQAVLAFSGYVEEACPGLVTEVLADLEETVTTLAPPPTPSVTPSATPSPTDSRPTAEPGSFCESWIAMADSTLSNPDYEVGDQVQALQAWFAEVDRHGLADDLPTDARAGFDTFVDLIMPLDPATVTERDLTQMERRFTAEQERQVDAFGDWTDESCGY